MKRLLFAAGLLLLCCLSGSAGLAQNPLPTSAPNSLISANRYVLAPRLGITHISSIDIDMTEERYRNALLLGTGWNRWPIYWNRVETQPGQLNWSAYDRLVANDLGHRLKINAILLGNPDFYDEEDHIAGMYEPVFASGSDRPQGNDTINPANPWANFVFQAVMRYKPGGFMARREGWEPDEGIVVWEAWNEPDIKTFWNGSINDYARLLKVASIAAKTADPNAQIMFGGLLFTGQENWLARALAIYQTDPLRDQFNWFIDIVAVHSYSYPWRTGWLVRWARDTLRAYGIKRPVWVNESGVPVWDDYPGPIWAANPQDHQLRATADQQAAFFIQSTTYAWAQGADVVFFHQLYDDCGDQPAGTDFPVHNGELCTAETLCAGDAFGLFRNLPDSACYTHHPFPGSPRPSASAFRLMADVFGTAPFDNPQIVQDVDSKVTVISFDRLTTGERIYVMWNKTLERAVIDFPANGVSAMLYSLDEQWQITPNADGIYQIGLPAATQDAYPYLVRGDVTAIGGMPLILVEKFTEGLPGANIAQVQTFGTPDSTPTPRLPLQLTPGSVVSNVPQPTVDPALDSIPPTASITALPEVSPTIFTVMWSGTDNSGIADYLIWVRVNGGEWQPWLETSRTEGQYSGEVGSIYEFAAWAVDLAGNWSTNTELTAQAATRVE